MLHTHTHSLTHTLTYITAGTRCLASSPTCGSCNSTECICPERGPVDQYPYVFQPFTFCQNETYCPADGSPCRCNSGSAFDCAPAADERDMWLGPHPEWVEPGMKYYSTGLRNDTAGVRECFHACVLCVCVGVRICFCVCFVCYVCAYGMTLLR
jgi:hypothetical protein